MTDFEKLFNPRAVGIIGVTEKWGGGYWLNTFKNSGFDKPIYIFNPRLKGKVIADFPVYGSVLEIPDDKPIDYVIVAVPARIVPTVLEECGKKGVSFATIFSSGFSEVGNHHLEVEVLEVVKKYNIRVIGPNCMGIFVPKNKITFSRGLLTDESGNFGGIFQSGGLAIYISAKGQSIYGTNPSKILSIGNQIDLNFVDFLEYFLEDDETSIIALYVENIKSQEIGRNFIKVVNKLTLKGKPVILWKVGSGEATRETIMSHTGGLAGSLKIWEAVAKQTGALMVKDSNELINLAMIFQHISSMPMNRNMGITTGGGGASIETADTFERYNLKVPKLAPETIEKFKEFVPDVNTIFRNPLDLGGSMGNPEIFYKCLLALDADPNLSAIIFIKVYDFNHVFLETIKRAYKEMKKPLICIAYKIVDDTSDYANKVLFKRELFKMKIPVFESVELAAKALDKMCTFREFQNRNNQ
ncbi:MAG: CoA-binding protein [Candidatus Lokiarchaeota archaeon]|nr:CoA-binding protein [Candidatus Lokiarchaeota archaeon]